MRYAENEQYEAAAQCRDTIRALEQLSQKQKVVASPDCEQDVVGIYSDDFASCISVFYIREGAVVDHKEYLFSADSIVTIITNTPPRETIDYDSRSCVLKSWNARLH